MSSLCIYYFCSLTIIRSSSLFICLRERERESRPPVESGMAAGKAALVMIMAVLLLIATVEVGLGYALVLR